MAALRSLTAEPHFMQDETYLRDLRDLERDHQREQDEAEDANRRYTTSDGSDE